MHLSACLVAGSWLFCDWLVTGLFPASRSKWPLSTVVPQLSQAASRAPFITHCVSLQLSGFVLSPGPQGLGCGAWHDI